MTTVEQNSENIMPLIKVLESNSLFNSNINWINVLFDSDKSGMTENTEYILLNIIMHPIFTGQYKWDFKINMPRNFATQQHILFRAIATDRITIVDLLLKHKLIVAVNNFAIIIDFAMCYDMKVADFCKLLDYIQTENDNRKTPEMQEKEWTLGDPDDHNIMNCDVKWNPINVHLFGKDYHKHQYLSPLLAFLQKNIAHFKYVKGYFCPHPCSNPYSGNITTFMHICCNTTTAFIPMLLMDYPDLINIAYETDDGRNALLYALMNKTQSGTMGPVIEKMFKIHIFKHVDFNLICDLGYAKYVAKACRSNAMTKTIITNNANVDDE